MAINMINMASIELFQRLVSRAGLLALQPPGATPSESALAAGEECQDVQGRRVLPTEPRYSLYTLRVSIDQHIS